MSYILDSTTIRDPQAFTREQVETSEAHETIGGKVKKQITNRRERFILEYQNLTQTQATTIKDIWDKKQVVTFQINESNLTIAETNVHVDIQELEYNARGSEYREDFVLILTESE